MSTRTQKSDSSKSSNKAIPAEQLIALPSLSCALSSLPQAKSMDSVSLHHPMSSQRQAESEAKLKKALAQTAASQPSQNMKSKNGYVLSHSPDSDQGLMMRKPLRANLQV